MLILKNTPNEGPGTIEDFLVANKMAYRIVDLSSEDTPRSGDFDVLVILGGPMSVNDEEEYPYISREIELVREFNQKDRKILGICLGAQIMARAFGARVYKGPQKEIGWYDIEMDDSCGTDRFMGRLAPHPEIPETGEQVKRFKVFQWHGETFDIPEGGVRLAMSELYPNQAFRYGDKAYAFQFHIEVKENTVYDWLKDEPIDKGLLKKDTELFYKNYQQRALNFYRYFF